MLVIRPSHPALPNSPFAPIVPLFLAPVGSDLQVFLKEAHALIESFPELLSAIEADLDAHALRKKALRVADAQWLAQRTGRLAGMEELVQDRGGPSELQQGRPRTSAYVVLIALLLRGFQGAGFKDCDVTSSMLESVTLQVFFTNLGLKMPGRSTLTELANAVRNESRVLVLDAQVAQALRLKLDDFTTMLQDSTHVAGNTEWPTDSRLMVSLVTRLLRVGRTLDRVKLPVLESDEAQRVLLEMARLDREIDFSRGKKEGKRIRRRRYEQLLKKAKGVHKLLTGLVEPLDGKLAALEIRPSLKALATRAVERLHSDLDALVAVLSACEARVVREEKVPMADKVLSLSDADAGFISKGQRDPVVGYKPQVARSGKGFITGLLLPQGNAPDSRQLLPMVFEVVAHTHVIPKVLSVDDGYASAANMKDLAPLGIEVVSINGAKGRALTDRADWNSDEYADARDVRSAVESLMFTLKQGFEFGQVARRGLAAAHADLLEKALAYNLCRMARLRQVAAAKASEPTSAAA